MEIHIGTSIDSFCKKRQKICRTLLKRYYFGIVIVIALHKHERSHDASRSFPFRGEVEITTRVSLFYTTARELSPPAASAIIVVCLLTKTGPLVQWTNKVPFVIHPFSLYFYSQQPNKSFHEKLC